MCIRDRSKEALQDMLDTCHQYASEFNLKFSTDPNPAKSKTKCLLFSKRKMNIEKMNLGDDKLPWVEDGKHLGNTLRNIMNGMKKDSTIKRAQYINRSNELCQEFYFCTPETKFMINRIYNSHFTGSSLWDLFNKETRKVENSWSVSFRKIYNLPRNTHRYFVEPISEIPHAKTTLIKNFLGLIDQIQKTHKTVARNLLETIKLDVRSTTGSNLREIMHLLNKDSIDDLSKSDVNTLDFRLSQRMKNGELASSKNSLT